MQANGGGDDSLSKAAAALDGRCALSQAPKVGGGVLPAAVPTGPDVPHTCRRALATAASEQLFELSIRPSSSRPALRLGKTIGKYFNKS